MKMYIFFLRGHLSLQQKVQNLAIQNYVAIVVVIFLCCFDLSSTYNYRATNCTPIMKKLAQ